MSKNFELLQRAQQEQESVTRARSDGSDAALRPALEKTSDEESIRLVQRLFLVPGPDAPRVVVFTAVDPGDGCTTVCGRVAETLAGEMGESGSFCVVDANLRGPSLHRYFGLENRIGLVDAVSQSGPVREYTQQVGNGRLWVMTAGSSASNIHSLLTSEGLAARVAELRSDFDQVLIDSPAVNLFADAVALGKLADGLILVLQSNATRREAARKAKEIIEVAKIRLLGAVLNKRRFPVPAGIYGRL
ncbi:MAG TPA: CpsD/CapB family tyrosine-protein kinase [Terriglobia bacterium]|nr:CpsD/CapB family tyrosine-protein kinase [Terriglobia bacterium]